MNTQQVSERLGEGVKYSLYMLYLPQGCGEITPGTRMVGSNGAKVKAKSSYVIDMVSKVGARRSLPTR